MVASLSLVCFCHLSVLVLGRLIPYINIYNFFAGCYISYDFLSSLLAAGVLSLEVKNHIFRNGEEGVFNKNFNNRNLRLIETLLKPDKQDCSLSLIKRT